MCEREFGSNSYLFAAHQSSDIIIIMYYVPNPASILLVSPVVTLSVTDCELLERNLFEDAGLTKAVQV